MATLPSRTARTDKHPTGVRAPRSSSLARATPAPWARWIAWLALALAVCLALPARAADDYVRIHFHRESDDYAGWGLHVWGEGLQLPSNLSWDHPLDPRGVDAFGIWFDVPVEPHVERFSFIVHRGETKSAAHDLTVDVVKNGREVWLRDGEATLFSKAPPVAHPFALGVAAEQHQLRTLQWLVAGGVAAALLVVALWRLARRRLMRAQDDLASHARLLLQAQDEIRAQGERLAMGTASADELTGLPTRGGLHQALEQVLARAARGGGTPAVLFVDLDGFKQVNDTAGHDAGDDVLRAVASRLKATLREGDVVARVGGDEFVVLLESASPMQAWKVGAKLVRAASQPVEREGRSHRVGASVGIALYPADGIDASSLIKAADGAMYDTKRAGRNACRFAQPDRQHALERQMAAQSRVEAALAGDELVLATTPVIELAGGRLVGMQAGARCAQDGTPVDVAAVLEQADDPRLAARLDRWLVTAACREAARTPAARGWVSVPIAASFADAEELPALVRDLLAEQGLPPQRLLLLFPAPLLADPQRPLDVLMRLRAQGVRIGFTGASEVELGLQRLTSAPVDLLQVDAASGSHARGGTAYMRALAAVGAQCGFVTAAIHVDTPERVRWAQAAGCTQGSGQAYPAPVAHAGAAA